MGLYIEARIRTDIERLWSRTQEPARHQRWDLRFTHISYLPRAAGEPQRFTYAVRALPGLRVAGTGITAGERQRPDGTRTSALRFASPHPLSPIAAGRGYWRYVPDGDGVRFLTGYDYEPRWGRVGRVVDRCLFRPLIGWGTAWSFDRLRLWCERGTPPERSLRYGLAESSARLLAVAVALLAGGPLVALPVAVAALAVRPLPTTPSARRCLRRPPERAAAVARTFDFPRGPERFDATMVFSAERGCIVDYLGTHQHVASDLHLAADPAGALVIRSGEHRFREGRVNFRAPELVAGDAVVRESYDDSAGCFRIEVRVSNRRFGPLFGYTGSFTADYADVAECGVRTDLRPVREEVRA